MFTSCQRLRAAIVESGGQKLIGGVCVLSIALNVQLPRVLFGIGIVGGVAGMHHFEVDAQTGWRRARAYIDGLVNRSVYRVLVN